MSPREARFNDQAELAIRMTGDRKDYWIGYLAGLLHAYFGVVTKARHDDLLHRLADEHALGYRDGYQKLVDDNASSLK